MKITLVEPKFLKDSISIISDLVTETRFRITKDLVEIVAMDPANVAMVIFRMPSNTFAEYEVKEDQIISINLNDFKSVLRRSKPNDVLTLEVNENKLKITLKEKSTRTFFLPLIDLEDKPQRVPNLEAMAIIEMPSSSLTETIEDMDIVSESITFMAEKDRFVVSAAGDMKKGEVVITASNEVKIRIQKPKEGEKEVIQKSKYSIEYLKKMMQGSKLASNVRLKFSKDFPLTLEYKENDKILKITINRDMESLARPILAGLQIIGNNTSSDKFTFIILSPDEKKIPDIINSLIKIDKNVKYVSEDIIKLELSFILAPRVDND